MHSSRLEGELNPLEIDGVMVDIYEPGRWFWSDDLELEKFEDAHKESGKELTTIMEKYYKNDLDHSVSQKDPMITRAPWYYSPKEEIEIDEFPITGGMLPDARKLKKIPEGIPTQKIRRRVYQEFAIQFNKSADIGKIKRESEQNVSRAVDQVDRNYGS